VHTFSHIIAQLQMLLQSESGLSPKARERAEWMLYFYERNASVSETCAHFGIPRSAFYRVSARFHIEDPSTLEDQSRRPHHVRQPTITPEMQEVIRAYREAMPSIGQETIAKKLQEEHGLIVPVSAIGRLIRNEGWYFGDSPIHQRRRLQEQESEPVLPLAPAAAAYVPAKKKMPVMATAISVLALLLGAAGTLHSGSMTASLAHEDDVPATEPAVVRMCGETVRAFETVMQWKKEHFVRELATSEERAQVEACRSIIASYAQMKEGEGSVPSASIRP
jgi:hypothetical protein